MRITVKPYITNYVTQVSSELGIDDLSEVVSIILLDHKRGLCGCTHRSPDAAAVAKNPNDSLADGLEAFLDSSSY